MSDFLSNFTNDNYDGKKKDPSENKKETAPKNESETKVNEPQLEDQEAKEETSSANTRVGRKENKAPVSRYQTEETEFDPTFKKRQRKKYLLIAALIGLLLVIGSVTYYQLTHVKVPDFVGKELSEARTWGSEEGVRIEAEQTYDFDTEVNHVISQNVPSEKKIKKGKTLTIKSSLGADPEEAIPLPEFKELDKEAAQEWITENKAENISLVESFDDKVAQGAFIKQEAANKELDLSQYKRKDRLSVYYSKGKETFEKNIEVPNFQGKTSSDVSDWAKKNEVKIKTVKDFSEKVTKDSVISQEIEKGQKIAKNDEFVIHVSKGKPIVVPDYSLYTMEEATSIEEAKIPVVIKNLYSADFAYGQFISQSVEAGKKYDEEADLPTVEVVYSQGQPYMKDLRGAMTEGDLPKLFFDDYQSKGAQIYYSVYYVDSSQPKGTVVEMSNYGQFLPMEATISIGISLGNLKGTPVGDPTVGNEEDGDNETTVVAPEAEVDTKTSQEE
ncbi:MAG TPA: PASTA domain-containing protein [Candidatus Tetragenococcus pullicola]|nr:PASTA domain-containing protein [Candidatus Tetragenococcus pullicola]